MSAVNLNLEHVNERLRGDFHSFKGLEQQQRTTSLAGSYLGSEITIEYQPSLSVEKFWLFVYRSAQSQLAALEATELLLKAKALE